ncbi:MAG: PilZ domain-containing protein [Cohaesibacter sp.]|nr:PilZ domain-containing protein [Cohaesibacter sp.]MCV6602024.1 PilZ domain-containing protein [Cohaesibacter sp.]
MDFLSDRRQSSRRRVLKGGKVFYNNFSISLDCTIRNESDKGMRLKVDPLISLPRSFSLLNRKDGTMAEVSVIWHHEGEFGVEFVGLMEDVHKLAKSDLRRISIIATRG